MEQTADNLAKDIIVGLKSQGFRLTSARRAIVEVLCARPLPFSVTDLLAELAERGETADKTTAYREIQFLQERGIARQVQFADGVKRYELQDDGHHHHLVCTSCDTTVDVPLENDLTLAEKAIEKQTGYKITRHSLEFFGLCQQCR